MTRQAMQIVAVVVLCAAFGSEAQEPAQSPRKRAQESSDEANLASYRESLPATLLGSRAVRDELNTTVEQDTKIDKVRSAYVQTLRAATRQRPDSRSLANLNETERAKWLAETRRRSSEAAEAANSQLTTILTRQQNERLRQLILQREGAAAFERPEVIAALHLTDSQTHRLSVIRDEARRASSEWRHKKDVAEQDRSAFFKKLGDEK